MNIPHREEDAAGRGGITSSVPGVKGDGQETQDREGKRDEAASVADSDFPQGSTPPSVPKRKFAQMTVADERVVVFVGRMGSGKTTKFGCIQGKETLQKLGPLSDTKGITEAKFARSCKINGKVVVVTYKCYDVEGFTGNQVKDLAIMNNLMEAICKNLPEIHVIYYCLTAVRFFEEDEKIFALMRTFCGPELINRLKFIITFSPEKLVTDELRTQNRALLSRVTGRVISDDDIMYSNLVDPNQFEEDSDMHQSTMEYWLGRSVHLQDLALAQNNSFPVKKISPQRKVCTFLYVHWVTIALSLFSLAVALLLIGLMCSHLRH